MPLVAPEPMSGLQRAALVGDSGSGVSSVLSWDEWSFMNIDLDMHLLRAGDGDWLLLDSVTRPGPAGPAWRPRRSGTSTASSAPGPRRCVISRRA